MGDRLTYGQKQTQNRMKPVSRSVNRCEAQDTNAKQFTAKKGFVLEGFNRHGRNPNFAGSTYGDTLELVRSRSLFVNARNG